MFKSGNDQTSINFFNEIFFRGDNGRRFILQQPLLYSETAYNYRRLGELWYQLMHSGIYSSIIFDEYYFFFDYI